ncbi:ABC transporter ATP-binding protein [Candidatus Contubernalis alkaliaceticus]|uniref:ABC transporter ATP-binding protein n=1 Tax=Candidatus Contubernalis alkaliaceticus TaxID=338645 RepID=UPI001F4C2BD5|nr:oligopeptide/dipeptide ABC transporter ATP-binding protein [Candidatus Contubernalis alkalaceticus]UNC91605.1 ATP-binding cassette domain-containing protein [Candidatus Contubernalis alkalaceticus]
MTLPLLSVQSLSKYYPIEEGFHSFWAGEGKFLAVDNVSFNIEAGETLSIIGESGCGKTTLAKMLVRLVEPQGGSIIFKGNDLLQLSHKKMRKMRREIQMIFQDPYGSLNPRLTVQQIIGEGLEIHGLFNRTERAAIIKLILEEVGLNPRDKDRYPREFSGGQRQRVTIARALVLRPSLIIADEPVSALDISIKSQIVNLLLESQEKYKFSTLFISHDLTLVRQFSSRVAIMYLGRIVEMARTSQLFENPLHIYTQALMSAVPQFFSDIKMERFTLKGEAPSLTNPPSGCHFHPRCFKAKSICKRERPELKLVEHNHYIACHLL